MDQVKRSSDNIHGSQIRTCHLQRLASNGDTICPTSWGSPDVVASNPKPDNGGQLPEGKRSQNFWRLSEPKFSASIEKGITKFLFYWRKFRNFWFKLKIIWKFGILTKKLLFMTGKTMEQTFEATLLRRRLHTFSYQQGLSDKVWNLPQHGGSPPRQEDAPLSPPGAIA